MPPWVWFPRGMAGEGEGQDDKNGGEGAEWLEIQGRGAWNEVTRQSKLENLSHLLINKINIKIERGRVWSKRPIKIALWLSTCPVRSALASRRSTVPVFPFKPTTQHHPLPLPFCLFHFFICFSPLWCLFPRALLPWLNSGPPLSPGPGPGSRAYFRFSGWSIGEGPALPLDKMSTILHVEMKILELLKPFSITIFKYYFLMFYKIKFI